MTISKFRIPIDQLAWKGVKGREVASKIMETYRFAELDQHRATTHNKGIMNGIDAVAIALG
jgi:hydroxymethylglutaryl-CoA reductase